MSKMTARAIFSVLALAALFDPVGFRHASRVQAFWIIQGVIVIILISMTGRSLRNYYVDQIKTRPGRKIGDIDPVPDRQAYELQRVAGKVQLTAKQARIFALAIMEPAELRQRVSEYYTPGQRTLEQEVEVEAQIPKRLLYF